MEKIKKFSSPFTTPDPHGGAQKSTLGDLWVIKVENSKK
jgi:hypothetical protein